MIEAYLLGSGGAPYRLKCLRTMGHGDWRTARRYTLGEFAAAHGYGIFPGINQWYLHFGVPYFRDETDVNFRTYGGWYTDDMCHDTAIGITVRLPHGRYISGYRWTANNERVYFPDIFDDSEDAARMASEHARVFAESAREHDERFQAMTLAEFDVESKTLEVQKAVILRQRAKFGGRDRVRDCVEALRTARETQNVATRDYEMG